ncbi:unnamed protein product [Phytomonas sp. EM1]|nr:unnamed protein product [Phytomonas sp. EM1]|eukprot:CCW60117.1 unnamed protein product [Phytomonas sp. isolate EM1]
MAIHGPQKEDKRHAKWRVKGQRRMNAERGCQRCNGVAIGTVLVQDDFRFVIQIIMHISEQFPRQHLPFAALQYIQRVATVVTQGKIRDTNGDLT